MSDTEGPIKPASPVRKTATRAALAGVSVVWLVPIIALIVTVGVAWNSFANRGTLIEVEFADATGITPGETALRFREISVGQVESVKFTADLSHVSVQIRVDSDVAQFIDDEASFWIVRPQVTAQGVTRLDTVLSGAFIEGYWDSEVTQPDRKFVGLERPPLVRSDAKGSWIVLQMASADGISEGAPILYHGVQVGQMDNIRLNEDGSDTVIANAFIEAPHDKRLTSSTSFWDTSGFSLSLGTSGVSFNVNSLASLLQGGVAFDTFATGGKPVETGQVFIVNPDEETARSNLFIQDQSQLLYFDVLVDSAVPDLAKGAEVKFFGLRVGTVTDISIFVQEGEEEDVASETLQRVTIAIAPSRLGLKADATPEDGLAFLQDSVKSGLRARVTSSGFFGSSLIVDLVNIPTAPEAEIDMAAEPHPIIPAVEAELSDFTENAEGFMNRIGKLPIEEVLVSATNMMDSITAIASSPETRAIPETLRKTIDEAQTGLVDINAITKELRESGAAADMGKMVSEATEAFTSVREAADEIPAMVDEIDEIAASMAKVDFAAIGAQAEGILADIRAMLGSEDAEALPRNLSNTLEAAAGLLNDLRDGNATESLNDALKSASVAADEISKAVQELPALLQRLQATAARAESVLAAYGDRSAFNNETINLLRELRRATASIGSLARMVERNPRAFILGR